MTVTAVIVNYHTKSLLPDLLDNLGRDRFISQIIIVDNSSEITETDFSADYLHIIHNEENRGFGAAVNQALAYANGEWILLMNPDSRFAKGGTEDLIAAAKKYETPLSGPRFYWDDDLMFRLPPAVGSCLWFDFASMCAGNFRLDSEIFSHYWNLRHQYFWTQKKPFFEPFLSGACLLIQKEWADSLGGRMFDERFFLYFEDTDLCLRAVLENIRPVCVPEVSVVHYYDQAPSPDESKLNLMLKSRDLFIKKYYDTVQMPLLKGEGIQYPELSVFEKPPVFSGWEKNQEEELYFEMALSGFFVPFVQAFVKEDKIQLPPEIWKRLSPGQYFSRIRGDRSGVQQIWRWEKR